MADFLHDSLVYFRTTSGFPEQMTVWIELIKTSLVLKSLLSLIIELISLPVNKHFPRKNHAILGALFWGDLW